MAKVCSHQYCPADRCNETEILRACRHLDCPNNLCLRESPGLRQGKMDVTRHILYCEPFAEEGHVFKIWQPGSDKATRVLIIQVFEGDGESLVLEEEILMAHDNLFGLDAEDVHALNMKTEQIIARLRA